MDSDPIEVRIEYEEEVVLRTDFIVETRDSSGCSLHRNRQRRRRGTPRQARGWASSPEGGQTPARDRAQREEAQDSE